MSQKFVENVRVLIHSFILWDLKFMGHVAYYHTILKFTDKHLHQRNMRKSMTGYNEFRYTWYPDVQIFAFK